MEGYRPNLKFVLILTIFWGVLFLAPHGAFSANQAVLRLSPASGSFLIGSTFDLSILLDTKRIAVNTVEVELSFPPDKLQLASPSVGKSIIQVWPAPPVFSNREGKIYFVGGIPSPGIVTSDGIVLTLTFRVVSPGEAQIDFGEKTSVLANDGRGTNILGQKPASFYRFSVPPPQGPEISSPTHPDQEKWYRDPNPVFVWPRGNFADGYSYSIDHDPSGFSDTSVEGSSPTASYQNLDNGIWYFHLRERAGGVWGGVSHFVVKIDNEPPASFRLNISPGRRTTNKNPIYRFFTTDSLSGFDHFEMKIIPLSQGEVSEALFFEVSSPYQSPTLSPGRYQVIVRALDRAGSTRDESVSLNILGALNQFITPEGIDLIFVFLPWFWLLLWVLGLLAILVVLFIILWMYHRRHLELSWREDLKKILYFFGRGAPPAIVLLAVLIGYYFLIFNFSQKYAGAAGDVLRAPEINVAPAEYYPLDESIYIEGRAAPKLKIQLYFEKITGGIQPVVFEVQANSNGEWFLSQKLELSSGEWSLRARVMSDPPSDWSNPRIIKSVVSGFLIGALKIKYAPVVGLLSVGFLTAGGLFIYSILRVRAIQRKSIADNLREKNKRLEKELREKEKEIVEHAVSDNFSEIRKKLAGELEHLETKTRSGGALNVEEEEHREKLLRDLREAEEEIDKKLKILT